MQKPWGSKRSYVGLLPRIELCRASLREDPYWWIPSLHTDDRGKVSNPPYIHLHLSFKPLSTDHHNCLLYKSRWDALTTSSSASSPLARTVADRPLFLFKKHPGKIGAPKNGSVEKKKVICPDLLHRSVIDELLPSYMSSCRWRVANTVNKHLNNLGNDSAEHSLCSWNMFFVFSALAIGSTRWNRSNVRMTWIFLPPILYRGAAYQF